MALSQWQTWSPERVYSRIEERILLHSRPKGEQHVHRGLKIFMRAKRPTNWLSRGRTCSLWGGGGTRHPHSGAAQEAKGRQIRLFFSVGEIHGPPFGLVYRTTLRLAYLNILRYDYGYGYGGGAEGQKINTNVKMVTLLIPGLWSNITLPHPRCTHPFGLNLLP